MKQKFLFCSKITRNKKKMDQIVDESKESDNCTL